MKAMRRLSALSTEDRRLLLQAVAVVGVVRLGLWVLPFRTLRRLLTVERPESERLDPAMGERIGWAVTSAARRIPAATCLTQALAAQYLLQRRGIAAELRIGVAREAGKSLQAHAWVESGGRIVVGGDPSSFTSLPALEGKAL